MSNNALVTNIQGYSIHDGTGIRTVVFLKGCPLRCAWCANPENLNAYPQIGFIETLCHKCGNCFSSCSENAIVSEPNAYRINGSSCTNCCNCAKQCFFGALVKYGDYMSAEEVFAKVRRDRMFYDESGGGVTVSGGEPLLYYEFVTELFRLLKEDGINTCVETCGYVEEKKLKSVMEYADYFLFDLKLIDSDEHFKYTGVRNEQILSNAKMLASSGADVLFRCPLIPGVNDTEQNIVSTAEFLHSLDRPVGLQLMPYHRMGESKYRALNMKYKAFEIEPMSQEEVEIVKNEYIRLGVDCSIST